MLWIIIFLFFTNMFKSRCWYTCIQYHYYDEFKRTLSFTPRKMLWARTCASIYVDILKRFSFLLSFRFRDEVGAPLELWWHEWCRMTTFTKHLRASWIGVPCFELDMSRVFFMIHLLVGYPLLHLLVWYNCSVGASRRLFSICMGVMTAFNLVTYF